jgi:hypothetical protein
VLICSRVLFGCRDLDRGTGGADLRRALVSVIKGELITASDWMRAYRILSMVN